jgi:hypothetical protein
MKKWFLLLLGAAALLLGSLEAGPITGKSVIKYKLEPKETKKFERITFRGKERACVIVIGEKGTPLWLFVRDQKGNLVRKDTPTRGDDLAVIWYPPRDEAYTIEVQNPTEDSPNRFYIAIR